MVERERRARTEREGAQLMSGTVPSRVLLLLSRPESRDAPSVRSHTFSPQSFCRQERVQRVRQALAARSLALLASGTTPEDLALQEQADDGDKSMRSAL